MSKRPSETDDLLDQMLLVAGARNQQYLLDHVIVLGERHLRRLPTAYVTYYHGARTHLALEKDAPTTRRVQTPTEGHVVAFSDVGGLHHRYERRAA